MIILGSNSTTRAKILKDFGINFTQKPCDFDEESIKESNPVEYIYKITKGKKESFEKLYGKNSPFLVADTVVVANGEILGKAKDKDDAKRMLALQSGNFTEIITCMIFKSTSLEFVDISSTKYKFLKFHESDLANYLNSDEWRGKAGACMVEGFCKPYIKEVVGFESTAMGLSIEKLIPFLKLANVYM
ncbi:MAG: septum formation inhibitor Maf [Campylobacteraceae bacterium]